MESKLQTRVRLDQFDASLGHDRGRSSLVFAAWLIIKHVFFLTSLPWPVSFKVRILRAFGATVGQGINLKPRVNIHLPWKLSLGDFCWIGEEVFILNFEPVHIGAHACVSQRAFLCGGNHDFRVPSFPFRNAPITVEDGAWVGATCFVAPGVTIGCDAVATVGSIVTKDLPAGMVCTGNPCAPIKPRWPDKS